MDRRWLLKLVITVDVEEEGLFSGSYPRIPKGVQNVRELQRLEWITSEFGLPLTLLVTYQVAIDPACQQILHFWKENLKAEIGAHLHHWNTPPFLDSPLPEPIPSHRLPSALLKTKLETLLSALEQHLGVIPRSFRMGRFDAGKPVLELLPPHGIKVDSSMVPFHKMASGADHFLTPTDPFKYTLGTAGNDDSTLLEAPLTIVPLLPGTSRWVYKSAAALPEKRGAALLALHRHLGIAGIHPAWFPLQSMKWAVRLHRVRGGEVLTMFLHSSELMPGATPSFRTEKAVNRLVRKMREFLVWLAWTIPVEGVTLSELDGVGPRRTMEPGTTKGLLAQGGKDPGVRY